jgi:GNAT superfamily N-acetyltransferase
MIPDTIDLARRMRRLTQWVDSRRQPPTLIRRQFRGGSLGNCYVTIDPDRQTPFASSNLNRVYMCGAEAGMSSSSVPHMMDLFLTERVNRFFVWLSPGPDMDTARGWLEQHGLVREIAAASGHIGERQWSDDACSARGDGFFHYLAFDGDEPVAIAALCVFEDIGYLMAAATAESHRKRGAQQALIAKRIERAEQAGCSILVSETLYMIEHSYRNLRRAGFQEAYEKEIYEWNA